jgi:pilus assembly protein Flp/PilA
MFYLSQLLQKNSVLTNVLSQSDGAAAIEYGLITAMIAIVSVAAFRLVGTDLSSVLDTVAINL